LVYAALLDFEDDFLAVDDDFLLDVFWVLRERRCDGCFLEPFLPTLRLSARSTTLIPISGSSIACGLRFSFFASINSRNGLELDLVDLVVV